MMKKIFALLVVFAMVLCFASCGPTVEPTPEGTACTNHVDNDGNGICDTEGCGATVENNGGNGGNSDNVKALAEALIGDGASLSAITVTGEYVKDVFVDANGKGYVVHLIVMSQYGTPETETLVHIDAEGKLAAVKKMIWKTSDAMYGFVPPADDVVDAFYAKLTGKTAAEFAAAFTGEGVELITGATSTSTKLVESILEAFEVVAAIENGTMGGVPMDPAMATTYTNAIFAAIESSKTVTATIDMTSIEGMTDSVTADGEVVDEGYYTEMKAKFDVTLAMTEKGLNIKAIGDASMSYDMGYEELVTNSEKMEFYLVDGMTYTRETYEGEWSEWEVAPFEMPEEVTGMITQLTAIITELLPEDFEITPEMVEEAKAAIAEAITALMTVNPDGSFGAKVDAKVVVDAIVDFVKEIKAEDTIGSVINKVIAIVDPEMTIEAILDEVGTYGSLTVGEIYAALDEAVTAELGMSINDIKNAALAEEAIVNILIENGVFDAETLAAIAETDLDVMIAEYAEMTIDDIVYMMFAAQSAPDMEVQPASEEITPEEPVDTTGTLAMMVTEIKGMLAMTVGEAMGEDYNDLMKVMNELDMKENYTYITFKIADDLSIEKIEFGKKYDCTFTNILNSSEMVDNGNGEYGTIITKSTATMTKFQDTVFTITSVSNQETVISAPEIEEAPAA